MVLWKWSMFLYCLGSFIRHDLFHHVHCYWRMCHRRLSKRVKRDSRWGPCNGKHGNNHRISHVYRSFTLGKSNSEEIKWKRGRRWNEIVKYRTFKCLKIIKIWLIKWSLINYRRLNCLFNSMTMEKICNTMQNKYISNYMKKKFDDRSIHLINDSLCVSNNR